jgi:hypothetical protein
VVDSEQSELLSDSTCKGERNERVHARSISGRIDTPPKIIGNKEDGMGSSSKEC